MPDTLAARCLALSIAASLAACGGGGSDAADAAASDAPGSIDARPADAPGAADALPVEGNVIYGLIEGSLVIIDPATAISTPVGESAADARFGWDPSSSTMYAILSPLSSPTLGAVDLCTGGITTGPAITSGGTQVPVLEGFAQRPDGTWFVSYDGTAGGGGPQSDTVGTIDLETGAVTALGLADTVGDDVDGLAFRDAGILYALDSQYPTAAAIYSVNQATGATTELTPVDAQLQRFTWDPTRGVLFGHDRYERELVTIDLATGVDTLVGVTHEAVADSPMFAFTSAPRATCPAP